MLIFKESGRLGNQIFQYAALKSICNEKELLLMLGFEDLQSLFDGIDAKIVNSANSISERAIYSKLYYPLIDIVSKKGLISRIYEDNLSDSYTLVQKKGVIESIKFVQESFFQNEYSFREEVIKSLVFKNNLVTRAKDLVDTVAASKTCIFVHIRRGDYLSWPTQENPAVLPISYYKKCIDIIYSKISNPFFIFTSDDIFYVKDIFEYVDCAYISRSSSIEDFVLMSHCHGGILSASSFSWWAAYFSNLQNIDSIFLAPNYWGGHRVRSWYPPHVKSSFLQYVGV
jgi:Glycosyl transferase family 11